VHAEQEMLASADATNLLLVTCQIPISAILLTTTLPGERLGFGEIAGMALIGLGLAAIDGRLLRHLGAWSGLTDRPTVALRTPGSDEG
jgi:hypothetical protein